MFRHDFNSVMMRLLRYLPCSICDVAIHMYLLNMLIGKCENYFQFLIISACCPCFYNLV